MLKPFLSRRDFLKLAASGSLAAALSDLHLERALAASPVVTQGRMTISGVPLYNAPTFLAEKIAYFKADQVVEVLAVDENGELGNPFNGVWYQLDGGYTYSGWVQPVETKYQRPGFDVPKAGQVGEITVPVSFARETPYVYAQRVYRIYYGSTHWVTRTVVTRKEKGIWYEIFDAHLKKFLYVPSYDMRLVPDDELALLSPDVPDEEKLLVVDLESQLVSAFEGDTMVFSQRCSSGAEGTETPRGEFRTYHKGPSVHMTNQGDALENIYNLPGVPWCTFFTSMGNAFHGAYWHNDYGRPRSHGCVNLPSDAAKFLYRWTRPNVPPDADYVNLPGDGTRVQII